MRQFIGSLIIIALFAGILWNCLTLPVVFLDGATSQPVGCATEETKGERTPITDPRCKTVLGGRYETEYVAPGR